MATDVNHIVHNHRDRARRCPQVHGPPEAAFRVVRRSGHVAPLLKIQAPHGPVVRGGVGAESCRRPLEQHGDRVR